MTRTQQKECAQQTWGLPTFPLYDNLPLEENHTPETLEWLLTHGMFWSSSLTIRASPHLYEIHHAPSAYLFRHVRLANLLAGEEEDHVLSEEPFITLEALLQQKHVKLAERGFPTFGWKWSCYVVENGEAESSPDGFSLPSAEQLGLPIFPIWDDMPLTKDYSASEREWLLEHGTLYRHIPPYSQEFFGPHGPYHEMTRYQGQYYFIEYAPQYRGDDHDQRLVTVSSYRALLELFHNHPLLPCEDKQQQWAWHLWEPATLANGGSL